MKRSARHYAKSALERLRGSVAGGARTLAGIAAFTLLALVAVGVIGFFSDLAARQNASALLYESAAGRLQVMLRGLNEVVVTEGSLASIDVVRRGQARFRAMREQNPDLAADTQVRWPGLSDKVEVLMRDRRNVALDEDALILLGSITGAMEGLAAKLEELGTDRRATAQQAERRIQIVNVAVGILLVLGAAVFFIVRDITARRVLGAVRASESQLRDITDAVPAVIVYVDVGRRFRFHNKATEQALGLTAGEIDGRTMQEVFGDEVYAVLGPHVDQVLAGSAVRFEHTRKDAKGDPRDYEVYYFPRWAGDRRGETVVGFYGVSTDITEKKRIDRMKTEFVSTVSHELRTPLTSIRGSLGLLGGGIAGKLPDAAKNLVEIARNNCERLIRLINDILDTEKIESGQMPLDLKVVDLQPLVAQALAANEGYAGQHQVSLALTAPPDVLHASVDVDRFAQVMANLLSNAIKFSPASGIVDVILSRTDERVRVEVRDRGPGIPEEFLGRIFQKFSQADSSDTRPKGGSGLGLNISKAIVERLGGTIGFSTELGVGTTFFFELPEWQPVPKVNPNVAVRAQNRRCILVCEDDADIGHLIGMMLDNAGYDSELALTATQALEMAAAKAYAAMTVDLKLPDQDGMDLIRALRALPATHILPIVVVSANAEKGRIQLNSETLSVSAWLGKPIDENRLVLAIRHAVEEGNAARPRILHVEDDPDIHLITAAVGQDFATFEFASTLAEARARLQLWKFDLVLLDLNLAEGKGAGWKLVADIEALETPPPIVIFSAGDVTRAESRRVAAVLEKARTSNKEFIKTLERVLDRKTAVAAEPAHAG